MLNRSIKKNMKYTLITLTLLTSLQLANAQEKLSREEALTYARAVSADAKQLAGTPIPTDVDPQQPVAVRDEQLGGMVLPQKNLKAEAIAAAGETPVPVGQLWLLGLTPMKDGAAIDAARLRMVGVSHDGGETTAPQCALAVRRGAAGLELLVYGKAKEPLLAVPLKTVEAKQTVPIDMTAERESESGKVTLKLLGKYQATISVTLLES
jgi:hypothetical protein